MRLRAINLACIFLLLSSLSAAEASVLRAGESTLGAHYIGVLLAQQEAAANTEAALSLRTREASELALPAASLSQHRTPWTMRPPSAHCVQLQAVTAFGI